MASCGPRKSESDATRELPAELKENILERLSTRDAARTALLSTHWNDLWLRHGMLEFDSQFFECFGDKSTNVVNIINDILMQRSGPVKKFTLSLRDWDCVPKPHQSDLDKWCRFLSRNGLQELDFNLWSQYKLPSCILLCRTIKELSLSKFTFDLPINARCIFSGVTSLFFDDVKFSDNAKGVVYSIPNLEDLMFDSCEGISNFEIRAPKLESFCVTGLIYELGLRLLAHHLKTIRSLSLWDGLLLCENVEVAALTFPTAINLEEIQFYGFCCKEQLTFIMQLLQNSPNLCKLDIRLEDPCSSNDIIAASGLLEDPNSDLKMLNTIEFSLFSGSTIEMLFVKMLLSKSPALERLVIQEFDDIDDASMAIKILMELLCFPRASPKAQIVCMDSLLGI